MLVCTSLLLFFPSPYLPCMLRRGRPVRLAEALDGQLPGRGRVLPVDGAEAAEARDEHRVLALQLADLPLQQLELLAGDVAVCARAVQLELQAALLLALERLAAARLGLALLVLALLLELAHLAPVLGLLLGQLAVVLLARLGQRRRVLVLVALPPALQPLLHLGVVFVELAPPLRELEQLLLQGVVVVVAVGLGLRPRLGRVAAVDAVAAAHVRRHVPLHGGAEAVRRRRVALGAVVVVALCALLLRLVFRDALLAGAESEGLLNC
ncbi:hypothetical protein ACCO45_001389 [Purpureocillium lilacinum]|uniref:Uncharacterized protein n=1 Tax=Purpureocillium lilacinum TaxID=33203 RepID=A0ACC4E9Q4_PURLI